MRARADVAERITALERMVLAAATADPTARLFMAAPGVGALTALSVASAFDDPQMSTAQTNWSAVAERNWSAALRRRGAVG